ncbi:mutanase [Colletotrichum higginsianum]|uniref:Mutanase n=1 Tax=Colletotrichum higginsianum (strain IMI 349063) TaxID=759273 RepID=H1UUU4_COLHI|nr:mutanase [Colletotrichum higginsianum]
MVGNTENYSASDWIDDITLAQEAHIDAFALNMAKGEPMNEKAISSVFSHAETLGFTLFFSFDYAGRGPYSKAEVLGWINKYASSSAYFRHNGQPLVSTFEGPEQAEDWIEIKAQTGCFFVPDWSSLGAGPAIRAAGGVADVRIGCGVATIFDTHLITTVGVPFCHTLSTGTRTVTIGGVEANGQWRDLADGEVGLWHGSSPFKGRTGDVKITVWRKDVLIAELTGPAIKNDCPNNGMTGFDAWAGGRLTSKASRPMNSPSLTDEVCIRGTGAEGFDVLCGATCFLGYCPKSACVCKALGAQRTLPKQVPGKHYPAEGLNSNYIGLCDYACLYGACFSSYCSKDQHPLIEPTVSPFRPPSCISGTGDGPWEALCSFTCRHGFCPIVRCKCNALGPLDLLNPTSQETKVASRIGEDHGLCAFSCARGFCPLSACSSGNDPQEQTDPVESLEIPHLDQDCMRFTDCVDLDNPQASSCGSGYRRQGHDRAGCPGKSARPICCKDSSVLPDSCTWRGSGGDCNGQCHEGEVTLFESNKGGSPGESGDGQCSRGKKVFCCNLKTFESLTSQCRWSPCGSGCDADELVVASAYALKEYCSNDFLNKKVGQKYCCKTEKPPLDNCHWVGQGDCEDNNCNNKEVALRTNPSGANSNECFWSRKKSLCCTPNDNIIESGTAYDFYSELCVEGDHREICEPDEYASNELEEEACPDDGKTELRRNSFDATYSFEGALSIEERALILEKRGRREVKVLWTLASGVDLTLSVIARSYPTISYLFRSRRGAQPSNRLFRMVTAGLTPDVVTEDRGSSQRSLAGYETEHNPDLQIARDFLRTAGTGILPNSQPTRNNARIDPEEIVRIWRSDSLHIEFPRSGNSRCLSTPNDYFMDQLGSSGNVLPLVATDKRLNAAKARIFGSLKVIADDRFARMTRDMFAGNMSATTALFGELRSTFNLY